MAPSCARSSFQGHHNNGGRKNAHRGALDTTTTWQFALHFSFLPHCECGSICQIVQRFQNFTILGLSSIWNGTCTALLSVFYTRSVSPLVPGRVELRFVVVERLQRAALVDRRRRARVVVVAVLRIELVANRVSGFATRESVNLQISLTRESPQKVPSR